MMKEHLKIVCYGEIVWDMFPDGKMLGGAPLNVALRILSLGDEVRMISKLGKDALAKETREQLKTYALPQVLVQEDTTLATGAVSVSLDAGGSAHYIINKPVAWDAITLNDANKKAVADADLFIFGSLAARGDVSKYTLLELLKIAKKSVFDVNLRSPHYDLIQVVEFMKHAHFIKMNDDELKEISTFLGIENEDIAQKVQSLSKSFKAKYICVTLGSKGALLYTEREIHTHAGFPAKVVDTVGAGDSFLAGMIHKLFTGAPPQEALAYACAMGALVASQKGANAKITQEQITNLYHGSST